MNSRIRTPDYVAARSLRSLRSNELDFVEFGLPFIQGQIAAWKTCISPNSGEEKGTFTQYLFNPTKHPTQY